jgi:hypothetical protein
MLPPACTRGPRSAACSRRRAPRAHGAQRAPAGVHPGPTERLPATASPSPLASARSGGDRPYSAQPRQRLARQEIASKLGLRSSVRQWRPLIPYGDQ